MRHTRDVTQNKAKLYKWTARN